MSFRNWKAALPAAVIALSICAAAQHAAMKTTQPAPVMQGLSDHHHAVTTSNPQAQQFFDQGVRLLYAFNHDEATRAFQHAADLDPNMAMAWWGVAYAAGPNYNLPVDAEREKFAYDAIQKAVVLGGKSSDSERAYIEALSKRYTNAANPDYKQLAQDYSHAMHELSQRYPDDLDAATMYAESLMDMHPWDLWKPDGTPTSADTPEIVSVLESVLKRDPNHVGAMHFYIHAVEASPHPEHALAAANGLASRAPAAGHLVHMPAHIYIRTGDYDAAVRTNLDAAKADEAYIKASNAQGIYPLMYYGHNLHFVAISGGMEGHYADAKAAADKLAEHVGPYLKQMPMLEAFAVQPTWVLLRFHRWDEVMKVPQPNAEQKFMTAMWHYSRGMALASTGKTADAEAELKAYQSAAARADGGMVIDPMGNTAGSDLKIADAVLQARIAEAKHDSAGQIQHLRDAVATQDSQKYAEPPPFYYPVRESLGAALLANGDAEEAEKVFRRDLDQHPRNARSLLGLRECLKTRGHNYDAELIDQQYKQSWKTAETQLNVKEL